MATRDRLNTSSNGDRSSDADQTRGGNSEYRDNISDEKTDSDATLKHSIITIAVPPKHLSDVGDKQDTGTASKPTMDLATTPKRSESDDERNINTASKQSAMDPVRKSETSFSGFDASKNAKIPVEKLQNPPEDRPAVTIEYINHIVGFGVFAARNFRKGEHIFHEAPIMVAPYSQVAPDRRELVYEQRKAYQKAREDHPDAVSVAFPQVAAAVGLQLPDLSLMREHFRKLMGAKLVHGRYETTALSAQAYLDYIKPFYESQDHSFDNEGDAVNQLFRNYAFNASNNRHGDLKSINPLADATAPSDGCIYLLGSLINHCCTPAGKDLFDSEKNTNPITDGAGPNCNWRIGPSGLAKFVGDKHILVTAKRDIANGEQLTWDYGKKRLKFHCQCDTCNRKPMIERVCRML